MNRKRRKERRERRALEKARAKSPAMDEETSAEPKTIAPIDGILDGSTGPRQNIMHGLLKRTATLGLQILRPENRDPGHDLSGARAGSADRAFLFLDRGPRPALRVQLHRRAALAAEIRFGLRSGRGHRRIPDHADRRHDRGQPFGIFRRDSSSAGRQPATPAGEIITVEIGATPSWN